MKQRVRALLGLLLLVVVAKVGAEVYDWLAHADERERLVAMREELLDAGVEVMRTRALLDTLRVEIDGADRVLEQERRALDAYGKKSERGSLPPHLYAAYRADLDRYNRKVARRNETFHRWESAMARNHRSVERYNALADSVRALAAVLGDPAYAVPSPLEAAVERGVVRTP